MNFTPINVRIAFDISHARTSVSQTGSVTCIIGLSSMSTANSLRAFAVNGRACDMRGSWLDPKIYYDKQSLTKLKI